MTVLVSWPMLSRKNLIKILFFGLILAFYGSLLLHKVSLVDDLPREINNGKLIIQGNLDVLTKNFYSYTEPNQPFANHHWLSGVLLYIMDQTIGFSGMVVLKTILLLLAFTLLFLTAMRKANFWLVVLCSIPSILILRERTMVRPEMFSYFLIAVFLFLLTNLNKHPESKKVLWLIPLQLLWVNLHLFFGIGILMTGGFLLEKMVEQRHDLRRSPLVKKLALLVVALILVSLINPYGVHGALFSLQLNILKNFPIAISELQPLSVIQRTTPPWDDLSVALFKPLAALLAASFIFGFRQKQKPIFYLLATMGTAVIAYSMVRALPLFGLMFLPAISGNLSEVFDRAEGRFTRMWPKVVLFGALIYLIFLGCSGALSPHKKFGIGLEPRALAATDFFKEHNLKGPVFNDTDIGSDLIYALYPQERVFVDNRFGDAYSASLFSDVYLPMLANEDVWHKMLARYQFNSIFFYKNNNTPSAKAFLYRRAADPDWSLVYADTISVIFVRNTSQNQDIINKFRITRENVAERLNFLSASASLDDKIAAADLFNMLGRDDLGLAEFLTIVNLWPNQSRIWMVMGEIELGHNDPAREALGVAYLEKAIATGQKTAEAYSFLGLGYYKTGHYDQARLSLAEALHINPERKDAKDLLAILDKLNLK